MAEGDSSPFAHGEPVERRELASGRPDLRVTEQRLPPGSAIPWHRHSEVDDTYYVLDGRLRVSMRDPDATVVLRRGEVWGPVRAPRPHRIDSDEPGEGVTFLLLQGFGAYDFVPLH